MIETLVEDIYHLFDPECERELDEEKLNALGERLAAVVGRRLVEARGEQQQNNRLRMSSVGHPCHRKLWYDQRHVGQDLRPSERVKFLFGDILEELLLYLAEQSGHAVEGQQDEVEIGGVVGHRDAVVDGVTLDVKSASSRSFDKFSSGRLADDDPFGYLGQLGSYVLAAADDPLVTDKRRGAFLVIDKQHGHICLDLHEYDESPDEWAEKLNQLKEKVDNDDELPARAFEPVPDGKSGNLRLGVNCSYCKHRNVCWPGVRTFLYSSGPRYLTEVEKEPKVAEVMEDGSIVSHEQKEAADW